MPWTWHPHPDVWLLVRPVHGLGEKYLYSVHMTQHPIFTLVAPPLLLLGTPGWLTRELLRPPALLMWCPLAAPLPEWRVLSPPAQMLYLFLQSIVPTVPASFLVFAERPIEESSDREAHHWRALEQELDSMRWIR